jgi:hypothetical protein
MFNNFSAVPGILYLILYLPNKLRKLRNVYYVK